MSKLWIIYLVLLLGGVFAYSPYGECYTDSDCGYDEYCNSYGECVPYKSQGSSCCGIGAVLLAIIGLGAFAKHRKVA